MLAAAHETLRSNLENAEAQLHLSSLHESLVSSAQLNAASQASNYLQQHNVDFAKVFDNDDLNQLFYESFKHDSLEPTPLSGGTGMSKSNSLDGLALLCNTSYGALNNSNSNNNSNTFSSSSMASNFQNNLYESAFSPNNNNNNAMNTNNNSNPLVNVMFIVDPATQKVICPRQTLHYQVGGVNNKTETTSQIIGPTVLVNHAQGLDIQQLLQQGLFSPTNINSNNLFASHSITPPPSLHHDILSEPFKTKSSSSATATAVDPADLPPLRALSAYNFYFRDERDRVLNGNTEELNEAKAIQLLQAHWSRDRLAKRRHRKTHGKIDFTTLSKLISSRWKKLDQHGKDFYKQVAARDWERYQKELGEYKNKISVDSHLAVVA